MADAVVGSVAVDVVPSAETFWRDFKAKTQSGAKKAGDDLGDSIGGPISDKVSESISEGLGKAAPSSKEQGSRQGASFADEFDKQLTTRLDAALKNLPDAEIGADTTEAQASIQQLRAQIDQVNKSIGVSITDDAALVKIEEIRAGLDSLSRESPDIRVRVDAGAASLELAGLQAQIDKLSHASSPNGVGKDLAGLGSGAESAGLSIGQLLIPALAGVALVAAPIAGSAAAALGTLAVGIKSAHVDTDNLTSAWHTLEAEAGKSIEPGLQSAIDKLTSTLPELNPLIDEIGSEAGRALDEVATWLGNGGMQEIVSYLQTELPIVGHLVESLGTDVVGFIQLTQGPANLLLNTFTQMADAVGTVEKFVGGQAISGGKSNGPNFAIGNSSVTAFGTKLPLPAAGAVKGLFNWATGNSTPGGALSSGALGAPTPVTSGAAQALNTLGESASRMAADQLDAAASTMAITNQLAVLTKATPNANTAIQGLLTGLSAYATSAGTAADKSKLLGAVLVASQGDALSYAGAVSQGYAATQALISTFQQQAKDTQSTVGSVNSGAAASALDKVTAATSRLNAAQIKANQAPGSGSTAASYAAQQASAAAAVAAAKSSLDSANEALDKASKPTGGTTASMAFADTEKAAIDLNTGLINLKATGAAPLVQQLQAMQTAAENAAEATYQHEVKTKGDSQALQDAQDIFESMTGGALVQNAKQLGLTGDQAKRLADQYFAFDGKTVTTEVQSIGLNDINSTLNQIGQQLSAISGKPWVVDLSLNASTLGKTLHDVVNDIGTPGHALGGMIHGPGTGTSDSILARLSNGEYVSTAASASRNAAALAAGNRGATLIAHYAAGGPVGMIGSAPMVGTQAVQHVTQVMLDGKVIATVVNEQNRRDGRRP